MTVRPGLRVRFVAAAALVIALAPAAIAAERDTVVLGWVETARIAGGALRLEAKLDTGADHSSIHAPAPEAFERGGEEWVRFRLVDDAGATATLERPVERIARVRSSTGAVDARYVVRLIVCVGPIEREVEVNLNDRGAMVYPLLIGRSFLAGRAVVDPGRRHAAAPACPESASQAASAPTWATAERPSAARS